MIWPCPQKVDCVGSDYPLMNVSSEGPDMPQFTAVGFCCNGQQAWSYSLASQVDAEDQLQRLMFLGCPDCAEENSYCADANCPDGTFLARYCLPTSQAEADTLANLHEAAMAPYCDGQLGDLFSATCSCPDGSQSMTAFSEISDADALNACQSVPRDCNVTPATNTQQICFSRCPDGTLFYWVVAAGTFYASTVAEANAMAYAVACQRAQIFRVCISGAVPRACLNNPYNIILTATSGRTYSWNVSGTVPPGLTATPIGQNGLQIQGTPTTAGTYTLVLTATDEVGNYMVKTITIIVWGIVQTSLPDGVLAADYDQQLTSVGGSAPYTYTLVGGGFPLGVDITSSGLITGVAGEEGTFSPQIRVTDHQGRTCTKTFSLTVAPACAFDSCEEHSLVDSGEPEPGYNQFAYASDQCYFCAMTTNGAGTVLRFNKYDPDTDTFVFKASVAVASASAFSNLVYDEFQKVFVTAALQTVIYFDPATDNIDTRNAPASPAIGYVDALVYVPAKQAVYGQFGRDGAGNFSIGHISDVIPIVIDGWWATSGGVKTHPLDLVYCPVNDSLYGANGGGGGGGLCRWDFASSTASFVAGPGGVVNVGTVFNPDSNLICCVAGVDYFELDPSTDTVILNDNDPDISLYGVGFATIIQGQQLILCAGYDSSNPFLTTALVGISLPSLDRQVFIDSDGNYNYRNAIILAGNSIMACGDADGTANSIVIRKCLSP